MVWWPTHTANNPDLFCHTKCKSLSVCLSLQFWMHFPSVAQRCYQNILGADTPTAETSAKLVSLTRFQTWIYNFSSKVIFLRSEGQLILFISGVINSTWGIRRTNITSISQIQITFIFISIFINLDDWAHTVVSRVSDNPLLLGCTRSPLTREIEDCNWDGGLSRFWETWADWESLTNKLRTVSRDHFYFTHQHQGAEK